MAKELYLYSPIYDFVAEKLIAEMEAAKGEDITIRVNTPGGNIFAGWGLLAKMQEHEGRVKIKADGMAGSFGLYMLAFADEVECLDITSGVLHRADGPVESEEEQAWLNDINAKVKNKLSLKINSEKLKELKGVTLAEVFNPDKRIDVILTAKEMKEIGLIDRIVKVNPTEITALTNRLYAVAAEVKEPVQPENNTNMDINKLKAEHPALFAEVITLGEKSGAEKESRRIAAWNAWSKVDAEAVTKGIESGKEIDINAISELTVKMHSANALAAIAGDSAGTTKTTENPVGENAGEAAKAKVLADFEAKVKDHFKITA
jgi:ATP-dependent protease ClpP protease subunit